MLTYPAINPIAFHLGPLAVHWYGIAYLFGFVSALVLGLYRAKRSNGLWTSDQVNDLVFYCALGVIIGGRIGYMLFYDFSGFLAQPLTLFKVWQGGMSFHGGFVGVVVAVFLFGRKTHKTMLSLGDFVAPLVPLGLAAGRAANFINGELWGRVTTCPWGMVFPFAGPLPRHPSPLYECLMEGVLLFVILWWYSRKPRPVGATSGLFLIFYGVFRIIAECFRQPDIQLGFLAFGWLTMGQLLSVPMIALGIYLYWRAHAPRVLKK